jgi:hypothetical protein
LENFDAQTQKHVSLCCFYCYLHNWLNDLVDLSQKWNQSSKRRMCFWKLLGECGGSTFTIQFLMITPLFFKLNGCQKLGLLSELAALKRPNKDPLINSVEKCKERLSGFRQKCRSLQACCPQRVSYVF